MPITNLNSDFESVWSLVANFTSKVLGSKWLFSEFRSKIETLIFRKVAKSSSKTRWQMKDFSTHNLQFLGILMAIDGNGLFWPLKNTFLVQFSAIGGSTIQFWTLMKTVKLQGS